MVEGLVRLFPVTCSIMVESSSTPWYGHGALFRLGVGSHKGSFRSSFLFFLATYVLAAMPVYRIGAVAHSADGGSEQATVGSWLTGSQRL